MGDLERDTRVDGGGGSYRSTLLEDWGIWGPNGGYVGAILLRAAAAESRFDRPVSLAVQFLARGEYAPVELAVRVLRRTRRAEAVAVTMTQGERRVADAVAWFVADGLGGLDHDDVTMPGVAPPRAVPTMDERAVEANLDRPRFPFWDNIEYRPIGWHSDWPPPAPKAPVSESWFRFRPRATFEDRVVDAARLVVVLDTMGWPAAVQAHAWRWEADEFPWVAPSLDLHVRFHRFVPSSDYLFTQAHSPVGAAGLISAESRVWSEAGDLLASAGSQLLCTPGVPNA